MPNGMDRVATAMAARCVSQIIRFTLHDIKSMFFRAERTELVPRGQDRLGLALRGDWKGQASSYAHIYVCNKNTYMYAS
jgi:hypothetical protein